MKHCSKEWSFAPVHMLHLFCCVPGMAHISEVEKYLQPRAVTPKA